MIYAMMAFTGRNVSGGASMNLASQQRDLLFAIVDGHLSGDGSQFIFVRDASGSSALVYPGNRFIRVKATEVDIRYLAEERLIAITREPQLSGSPTQLGIETAALLRAKGPSSESSLNGPNTDPSFWRRMRSNFDELATRERSILGQSPHDKWLRAYCDFSAEHDRFGSCRLQGGLDGRLISDFEDVATQGACGLGCPPGVEPVGFWLYRLAQDLLNTTKPVIRSEFSSGGEWGGYIQGLLDSSAAYCSRLAAQAERKARDARFQKDATPPTTLGDTSDPASPTAKEAITESRGPTPPQSAIASSEPERVEPGRSPIDDRSQGDPTASPPSRPGDPIFENPFPDTDPRHSILGPYFELVEGFGILADEYPKLSAVWKADFGSWRVWPLSHRRAGAIQGVPTAPGAELHLERSAGQAAELLLNFSGDGRAEALRVWANPARDRWLKADDSKPWEFWLYAIREFWLNASEEAKAAGADLQAFQKTAEQNGYLPANPVAISERVWSLMVTGHRSLKEIVKEYRLSAEIGQSEEVAGSIQGGKIACLFRASRYFCGVLAARRARELANPPDANGNNCPDHSDSKTSNDLKVISAGGRQCNPQFWRRFSLKNTSKTSIFRDFLVYHFVSLTIPANRTNHDVVEQIAKESHIPVESLPDDLNRPVFPRGRPIFGFAGDEFDEIARNYEDMYWWLSDTGLNMAIVNTAEPLRIPTFDELISRLTVREAEGHAEDSRAMPAPENASPRGLKVGKRRGRLANHERRNAIRNAINKHGDQWRDHLDKIFAELDSQEVAIGDLQAMEIDLGDGQSRRVTSWDDFDLAQGEQRRRIVDALRKYAD